MAGLARRALCTAGTCALILLASCSGGGSGGDTTQPPTVTLTANQTSLEQGDSAQLTWSSTNATSCTASGGWSGNRATSGAATSEPLLEPTVFNLSCTGSGGTAEATVTVGILPHISISASPPIVRTGATSTVAWTVTNATDCEGIDAWSGDRPLEGSEVVGPLSETTQFGLRCTGEGGTNTVEATVEFREGVNVPPQADAGPDQTVIGGATVHLNGIQSVDDYSTFSWKWTQTAGPTVVLNHRTSVAPDFVAPLVSVDTVLTFLLRVTDDEGRTDTDTVEITVQPVPDQVAISGNLSFENIPHGSLGNGLNYLGQGFVTMTADVLVEAIDVTTQAVLSSGRFAGEYELNVPSQSDIAVRVTAEMLRETPQPNPHWHVKVWDLDDFGSPLGPIHSYTSPEFNSGSGGIHHINIPSGWDSSGRPIGPRYAAPFAILEDIALAIRTVVDVDPSVNFFPELNVDWGPDNFGGDTYFSHDPGGALRIVLSGEPDVDTEEYDPQVVLHEFGHYLADVFSRSDSVGGQHGFGDVLDMRVAFGEGMATVFGAIVLGDPVYRDSFGVDQGDESYFDLEDDEVVAEGWYSEASTWELGWDLYDGTRDSGDNVALGFGPIWDVMKGPHRDTDAATSMFSFATLMKQAQPADATAIATLLVNEQIQGSTIDEFGTTETNDADSPDVLPVYTPISLGQTVRVRSTSEFGTYNKLSNHRFLSMTLAQQMSVRFTVSAASGRDPDIAIYRKGSWLGPENLGPADEDFTMTVGPGELVLDVYDCGNADCNFEVAPAPTEITISVSPN